MASLPEDLAGTLVCSSKDGCKWAGRTGRQAANRGHTVLLVSVEVFDDCWHLLSLVMAPGLSLHSVGWRKWLLPLAQLFLSVLPATIRSILWLFLMYKTKLQVASHLPFFLEHVSRSADPCHS